MLDQFVWGKVSRISPEAPVPVVEVTRESFHLGGAANVAMNIASLGSSVSLLGFVGEDEQGRSLVRLLERAGVDCCFERPAGFPTITKLRVLSRHQQLIRLDFENGFPEHAGNSLLELYRQRVAQADVVAAPSLYKIVGLKISLLQFSKIA